MIMTPTLSVAQKAAANLGERLFRGGLADTRPSPHAVILDEPRCRVMRFAGPRRPRSAAPIVLVPPIGAPAKVFDLRRGCSMAAELAGAGHRVYVLDYGRIGLGDRAVSIADLVASVGRAVDAASRDSGGLRVVLAGWCAGGLFAALHTASQRQPSRVAGLALLATPLDLRRGHPLYGLARLPVTTAAMRVARETGVPAFFVSFAFRMTSPTRQLLKPVTVLRSLPDREALAHIESVDEYIDGFAAYPGVAGHQLLRSLIDGDLAEGRFRLGRRRVDLRRIAVPTVVVAGRGDGLAPAATVRPWTELIDGAEFHLVAGGHLGVVAGSRARDAGWRLCAELATRVGRQPLRRPARSRRAAGPRRAARRLRVIEAA